VTTTIRINDRFRNDAIACLVQLCRDEQAPSAARATAATKLLEYAVGRPVQAKAITIADVDAMSEEQRQELLHALLTHYQTALPDEFQAALTEAVDAALAQQAEQAKPNRFTRGPVLPAKNTTATIENSASSANELNERAAAMRSRHPGAADERRTQAFSEKPVPLRNEAEPPPEIPQNSAELNPPPPPPTRGFRGNGLIGDIPIDQDVNNLIRRNGAGNGHDVGSDMSRLLSGYNAARWRYRQ
jgi:hypothetical protein